MSDALRKSRHGIVVRGDPGVQLTAGEIVLPLLDVGSYRRAVFSIRQVAALVCLAGEEVDFIVETNYDSEAKIFADSTEDLDEAAGIDDTQDTFTVDDGTTFEVGDVIRMDAEYMRVLSIATNDLTVERGWFASARAAHLNNVDVFLMQQSWVSLGNVHYGNADNGNTPTGLIAVGGPDPITINDIAAALADDTVRNPPFGDTLRLRVVITNTPGFQYECIASLLSD